jgi:hypothetical protein
MKVGPHTRGARSRVRIFDQRGLIERNDAKPHASVVTESWLLYAFNIDLARRHGAGLHPSPARPFVIRHDISPSESAFQVFAVHAVPRGIADVCDFLASSSRICWSLSLA